LPASLELKVPGAAPDAHEGMTMRHESRYGGRGLAAAMLGAVMLACAGAACAQADEAGGLLTDRFVLSLGTYLLSTNTQVELNGSAGTDGSNVDLKRDLGLQDSTRFRLDGSWRFARRHQLSVLYFDNSSSTTHAIDRELTIRDTVYPVNAQLASKIRFDIAELIYQYSFLQGPTYDIGASAGIHAIKFNLNISGMGTIGGQSGQFSQQGADTTAPLPVFGLHGLWEFYPKWYLDARAQYFGLKYQQYDGHLWDLRASATRMFGHHFGVGVGWDSFRTDVGITSNSFNGNLRWGYSGLQLFVTAAY
jgi:hypothetical protein